MSHFNTRGDKNLTWDQIKGTFLVRIIGLFLLPSWELLACNMRNWERKRQNSAASEQPYPPAVSKADTLAWILKFSSIFSSLYLEVARVSPFHQKKAVASGWTGSRGVMLSLKIFLSPDDIVLPEVKHLGCSESFGGWACPHEQ